MAKSIFRTSVAEDEYLACYNKSLGEFGLDCESDYITTPFGDTHVLRFGDSAKKPLILLHGMTMSSTMWYPNVKELIRERCVYAIDIMGDFGKSKPNAPIKSRVEANHWLRTVLEGLGLNRIDLAGHSMGGYLALNYALAHPEQLTSLALLAPAGSFHPMSLKFFAKIYPALLLRTEKRIDRAFRWFSGTGQPLDPVFRSQVIAGYRNAKPLLQLMPSAFKQEDFARFSVSTLLLVGDKEVIYPALEVVEKAKRLIPGLHAHVIPGASHSLTIEHANEVNHLLIRFLVELRSE
ncbi:alpha/beta fold hydrolase [Paenibacillus sp. NPDC057967]|uniref:alpha/beta fold hydrolase n=1 Tax=Paenibacillus sp. NPDC057967 TaxID=3346293 RepID=UPI0036DF64A8